jgi:hypothetical protein
MELQKIESCTAFANVHCVATGELERVVSRAKEYLDINKQDSVLIFDDHASEIIEIDFRGTMGDVLSRLQKRLGETKHNSSDVIVEEIRKRPGRPKLGVVAREVTLLPRHWEWLNSQPGGASVALRKLVEEARRVNHDRDRMRQSQEATYRFMAAMAGDMPGFEEAARALFALDSLGFMRQISAWPHDIVLHLQKLTKSTFAESNVMVTLQ